MFEVVSKNSGEVYKVYDVIRLDGIVWFLIYVHGEWEYYRASSFEPYKEVY